MENNLLQHKVFQLDKFACDNFMKINEKKTKVAIFNTLKNIDILPHISLQPGAEPVEAVKQYRLLG